MSLPDGQKKHGAWYLTADGYHVDWTGGPSADWRIDYVQNGEKGGFCDADCAG